MKLKKLAHTVYKTQYHIVWVTRFRRKTLHSYGVKSYLRIKLKEVRKWYPDWEYIETGIADDHVHLHLIIPPKYSVSYVVETLKKNTSRHLRRKFEFLSHVYWDNRGIWAKGYFVSTVGINEETIKNYIALQEQEDTGQAELVL
jgi:putative transposase